MQSPQDSLVIVLHWNLISNGFKCCGIGDEDSKGGKKSEMLPRGWNDNQELYTLRYKPAERSSNVYLLKIIRIDDDLLVHFMEVDTEKVTNINIRTKDYTTGDLSSFDAAFKNLDKLSKLFKKELIDELMKEPKALSTNEPSTSRTERSRLYEDDPLRVPPRHPQRQPVPRWTDADDPFSVGRGDLDPFGRGQGGMLFDPSRSGGPRFGPDPSAGLPGRLPRGAVPPGARFDHFGPPGTGPGPDPDHLPPPGYDDMFM